MPERITSNIIFACALSLALLLFSRCENDAKKIKALTEKVVMKEEATQVDSYFSQNGKMKAR